jgi:His-Xaa-Ser system radical SAM maturase HxsB
MAGRRDRPIVVEPPELQPSKHAGARNATFRFRELGDRVLMTNDLGDWLVVGRDEFDDIVEGRIGPGHPLHRSLAEKGFLLDSMDVEAAVERYRRRTSFLGRAPYLHIVVTTLRCNEACIYCHASREPMSRTSADMDVATAKRVVDTIFESPSHDLAIEFQGGEPLANFETLRFIVEYATEKNAAERRDVQFLLVTNMALMDEEKMRFLLDNDVLMCTSLDGPRELHDATRRLSGGSAHEETVKWIRRIAEEYARRGRDADLWHVDALLTTTRESCGRVQEIVDEYVDLGIKTIHIRPLNPMGFASRTWERIGYTPEEFIDFYREALDYIIELNLSGVEIIERGAALFLARVLSDEDHGYVDLRSPCGAGVGQLAYDQDGRVYTCDEGRMVARMGDDIFRIGEVGEDDLRGMLAHDSVRAIGVASCLEALPGCRHCAYMPYCGVCPVYNYVSQGDLFGQRPTNDRCRTNMLALDHIFDILAGRGESVRRVLERWIIQKPRTKNARGDIP